MSKQFMSFENVDGRTTETCLYYKLTYGPSASGGLDEELVYMYVCVCIWMPVIGGKGRGMYDVPVDIKAIKY